MAPPKRQRRAVCPECLRPTPSACICSALPATRLQLRSVHCVVLQHPHEAALKNASLPLVQLCVHPDNLTVLIGRRLPTIPNSTSLEESATSPPIQGASNTDTSASSTARRPEIGWIQDGDRDVWLLFTSPTAISLRRALQQRQHPTKKIVLLVLDGTWKVCARACALLCVPLVKNWFMKIVPHTLVIFTVAMDGCKQFAREMDRANVQHDCYPRHLVRVQFEPDDLASCWQPDTTAGSNSTATTASSSSSSSSSSSPHPIAFRPRRFDIRTPPTDEHLSTAESMAIALACIESDSRYHFAPDNIGNNDDDNDTTMETPDIYSTIMKPLDLMVQQWHGFTREKKQKQDPSAKAKRPYEPCHSPSTST
jgi:DTW domain